MGFSLVGVKYKEILAIDQLDIRDNRITCIVGESGSGKTTLLRLLNNMISAETGIITYHGVNIEDYDPIVLRRKVTMLPQSPTIFPGTIAQNLELGLEFSGQSLKSPANLHQAMQTARLNKELDGQTSELSGGEKQRLALARILLLQPEVLLLDEPSSALDDETERLVIESIVCHAREREVTLIMVTHSRTVAESYGDVVITVSGGKVTDNREAVRS